MELTTTTAPVAIDSLVRGTTGIGRSIEGRVFRISSFGWVALVDRDGRQWIAHPGHFDVVEGPRSVSQRTDIPERLR